MSSTRSLASPKSICGVVPEEERVLDAGVPGGHGALEHDHVVGVPDREDGHAGDRAAGVLGGGGVDGVVRADDQDDGGVGEVVVDLVHLEDDVVGDLGLGEQDVHVAGQSPGDGVDAEPDVDAALAELAGEVGDAVLRLGDGHAVAGGDDHRVRSRQQLGHALGGDLAVLAVVGIVRRASLDAEAAGDDGDERAVHRLAHDVGQVGTRGADQGAGDDQQVVLEQEAGRGRGPARSS